MQKSTLILGTICLLLSVALGIALSFLTYAIQLPPATEQVAGNMDIGLPNIAPSDQPTTDSVSTILWDQNADIILHADNAFERRPIASLTKIMTAMVAIDTGIDWNKVMAIKPEENVIGGNIAIAPNETLTMRDLFHASLMGSANNATLALVRGSEVPEKEFIDAMNRKAIALGLEQTEFMDVTGLDPRNQSTAYEMARLAETAFNEYPNIAAATSLLRYEHTFGVTQRNHTIVNTNNLMVDYGYQLSGSKTGFLNEAGYCLAVHGANKQSNRIAVVLGAKSEWDSMNDVKNLLEMP